MWVRRWWDHSPLVIDPVKQGGVELVEFLVHFRPGDWIGAQVGELFVEGGPEQRGAEMIDRLLDDRADRLMLAVGDVLQTIARLLGNPNLDRCPRNPLATP